MSTLTLPDTFWMGKRSRKIVARLVVEGDLELLTPAHFGNGDSDDATDLPLLTDALKPELPLLTGSSLAGALRAYLWRYSGKNNNLDSALFGGAKADDDGKQSPLITDDALGHAMHTELRDGVKLNPASRTAADKALFNIETWAAGTSFPLRLELALTDIDQQNEALRALAAALTGLSNGAITLGSRKTRGYGKVQVEQWRVRRYELAGNTDDLLAWMSKGNQPLRETTKTVATADARGLSIPEADLINALLIAFGTKALPVEDKQCFITIKAKFRLESSLMIRGNTGTDDLGPDMVHLHSLRQDRKKPIVSGTSLAGALRGRAAKIVNTLAPTTEDGQRLAKAMLDTMFGPEMKGKVTPRASRVIVEESEIKDAVTDLVQNRIRIDRFTGGVVEGALFNEQPAFGKGDTTISITLKLRDPKESEIGLLLLLLKDLWTGDLPLGGETAIGRGRLKGIHATVTWKIPDEKPLGWEIEQTKGETLDIQGDERDILEKCVSEKLKAALQGQEVAHGA